MMVEAVKKNLVKPPDIVRKLNQSPEIIKGLNEYFVNTQKINEMGIEIRPVTFETVIKSQMVRMAYGLMVNDSVIVASMQEEGLKMSGALGLISFHENLRSLNGFSLGYGFRFGADTRLHAFPVD